MIRCLEILPASLVLGLMTVFYPVSRLASCSEESFWLFAGLTIRASAGIIPQNDVLIN
jgi:hypothetical protein